MKFDYNDEESKKMNFIVPDNPLFFRSCCCFCCCGGGGIGSGCGGGGRSGYGFWLSSLVCDKFNKGRFRI